MSGFSLAAIKFALVSGAIYFQVEIDHQKYNAVMDSGAKISAVSTQLAARLHLPPIKQSTVHSDVGSQRMLIVGPLHLKIGNDIFALPQVLAANLSLVSETGQESDIIIGQDVLEKVTLDVSFSKNEMHIIHQSNVADYTANFHKLIIDSDQYGRLVTKVQIDDAPPASAIVDLGNSSPIMMADSFRKIYHLNDGLPTSTGLIGTISGVSKTVCYSTKQIKIGDLTIADVPTDALADWSAPQPINLGLPIFQQFGFIFDLPNHAVWLRQEQQPHFEREMSGLLISYRGSYLEIVHIASNSPADDGRFHVGDKIYAINHKPIDIEYFRTDDWKWRYGPSGKSVYLDVSGQTVNIKLKRYY